MNFSRYFSLLLFLNVGFVGCSEAQSTATSTTTKPATASTADANTSSVVNYSFSTNKMDVLPFDKPFVFHLTDFPSSASSFTSIRIVVIQLPNKNPKANTITHEIVQNDPANPNISYPIPEWQRSDPKTAITTVDIPFTDRLPPNRAYQVQISLITQRGLTDDEKTTLASQLDKSKDLDMIIDSLTKQCLAASATASSDFLLKLRAKLALNLKQVVKTIHPNYELHDSIPLPDLGSYRDALGMLKLAINDLKAHNIDTTQLAAVIADLDTTDFYNFNKKSKLQTDITALTAIAVKPPSQTSQNNLKRLQVRLDSVTAVRDRLKKDLIKNFILPNVFIVNPLSETYNPDFVTNSKFYINLDAGFAYVWRIDRALAYSGFNIYFRPIDKTIPLSSYSGWDVITTRTSLLIGISLGSVAKANVRKGLIGNDAFILGGGFKINPFLKVNGGWFMNYRYDPDPLVTQNSYHFSLSPFVSLSLDLDVKPLFTGLSDAIFK